MYEGGAFHYADSRPDRSLNRLLQAALVHGSGFRRIMVGKPPIRIRHPCTVWSMYSTFRCDDP